MLVNHAKSIVADRAIVLAETARFGKEGYERGGVQARKGLLTSRRWERPAPWWTTIRGVRCLQLSKSYSKRFRNP